MPETVEDASKRASRTIAVIDGNSLMHRAFHAIRQPMTAPDGRATNALFGFFNMFIKLVESFSPDGVICAFDKGKPQVRIDMLPQYKAQRPPMDPALHEQFPMVKDLLRALDVPVVELQGWEGDDILGTLARRGEAEGYEMLLFTGDRDMYQLATDHVKIVATKKGVSDVSIMTPESVDDLYHGITPKLVPDFYGLKGDSSDNIPGVPGIGPKKAAALIVQYGDLDNVIAHADEVKGKMGENLRAHVDDALLSRKVATIRTDAPIDLDLKDAKFPTFDPAEVTKAFSALGFTGMTQRLVRLEGEGAAAEAAPTPTLAKVDRLEGDAAEKGLDKAVAGGTWAAAALEREAPRKGQQSLFAEAAPRVLWVAIEAALLRFEGDAATSALV
ncbi:MAG: 5'-3' exonuclease H3TH domain-containing protein, partial [Parafannyhessea sp.]|uniref:5'-3' exonuclease n=1 Tax=Parafannyhessea sp. TaxID=2847324 RepID=UPI003EFD5423